MLASAAAAAGPRVAHGGAPLVAVCAVVGGPEGLVGGPPCGKVQVLPRRPALGEADAGQVSRLHALQAEVVVFAPGDQLKVAAVGAAGDHGSTGPSTGTP